MDQPEQRALRRRALLQAIADRVSVKLSRISFTVTFDGEWVSLWWSFAGFQDKQVRRLAEVDSLGVATVACELLGPAVADEEATEGEA